MTTINRGWAPDSWKRPEFVATQTPDWTNSSLRPGDPDCCDAPSCDPAFRCTLPAGHDHPEVLSDGQRVARHYSAMGATATFSTEIES